MAAAVDTESGHFFDAVCFRLEQPRGCAGAFLLGLAMAIPAGAGTPGVFCRWRGGGGAGHGATLVASKAFGTKSDGDVRHGFPASSRRRPIQCALVA